MTRAARLAAWAVAALLLTACGSDTSGGVGAGGRAPTSVDASSSSTNAGTGSSTSTSAGAGGGSCVAVDGSSSTGSSASCGPTHACSAPPMCGDTVVVEDFSPASVSGGTILDGAYELVSVRSNILSVGSGVKSTLDISCSSYAWSIAFIDATSGTYEAFSAGTLSTSGHTVTLDAACSDPPQNPSTLDYDAHLDLLTLAMPCSPDVNCVGTVYEFQQTH